MTEPIPLPDLPDGDPAGPDLGLDPRFGEMELAAKGKPEGQFGNTIEPAAPPDWKLTGELAEDLLTRTRDLRMMTFLAVARLNLAGLPGFAAGLSLLRNTLETNWENVHPKLDPEDDNDPMQRANALLALRNPVSVLRPVREAPLARHPRGRAVTFLDLAVLNGALEPEPGRERMGEAEVRATFVTAGAAAVTALRADVEGAVADIALISATFDTRSSPGSGPDLTELAKLLRDVGKELARYEAIVADAAELPEDADAAPGSNPGPGSGTGSGSGPETATPRARGAATIRSISVIGTRDDALHALELAAAYFRTNEPSSPIPMLIDRARRLAPLPFLEILRDLAPDGLLQAQTVAGTPSE